MIVLPWGSLFTPTRLEELITNTLCYCSTEKRDWNIPWRLLNMHGFIKWNLWISFSWPLVPTSSDCNWTGWMTGLYHCHTFQQPPVEVDEGHISLCIRGHTQSNLKNTVTRSVRKPSTSLRNETLLRHENILNLKKCLTFLESLFFPAPEVSW